MLGKTVLITGASSGIGKYTAIALARQGATVILHGRDHGRVDQVRRQVLAECGHRNVDILIGDLSLMSDTVKMATDFRSRYDHLDVLINNAGAMMGREREETAEGLECTFAINLMGPWLLTNLLLDLLKESSSARIVNVSSSAHRQDARPDFNDLQSHRNYAPLTAYGNAKLYLILASQWLSRKLVEDKYQHITVNTLHPGAVATNFSRQSDLGFVLKGMMKLARRFFKTAEQGAETLIYLASAPEVQGITGHYFVDKKMAVVNKKYDSITNEQIVWDYCEHLTGVRY
ncbi:SDR family NAD(P)-dependent oxidoreductase [Chitinophaga sp. Cy-1792]|uniref:SDR family NAD(P)-dependent oxidoreductase n=1 Tax=Chitinophaga sp. Cy-1792 TaxID=2608339 RepID=UPI001420E3E2|nr:SDR family NAD(P)-dependent oxidoreductase [Chitinophaga sp. Cy-1792]NIG55805.1 SDR family NAD(P)-dependent oxidoreductase [Chitinophaga sp. Cy-1792]